MNTIPSGSQSIDLISLSDKLNAFADPTKVYIRSIDEEKPFEARKEGIGGFFAGIWRLISRIGHKERYDIVSNLSKLQLLFDQCTNPKDVDKLNKFAKNLADIKERVVSRLSDKDPRKQILSKIEFKLPVAAESKLLAEVGKTKVDLENVTEEDRKVLHRAGVAMHLMGVEGSTAELEDAQEKVAGLLDDVDEELETESVVEEEGIPPIDHNVADITESASGTAAKVYHVAVALLPAAYSIAVGVTDVPMIVASVVLPGVVSIGVQKAAERILPESLFSHVQPALQPLATLVTTVLMQHGIDYRSQPAYTIATEANATAIEAPVAPPTVYTNTTQELPVAPPMAIFEPPPPVEVDNTTIAEALLPEPPAATVNVEMVEEMGVISKLASGFFKMAAWRREQEL